MVVMNSLPDASSTKVRIKYLQADGYEQDASHALHGEVEAFPGKNAGQKTTY